jgi:hypothetical protein
MPRRSRISARAAAFHEAAHAVARLHVDISLPVPRGEDIPGCASTHRTSPWCDVSSGIWSGGTPSGPGLTGIRGAAQAVDATPPGWG